ncbi:hypothetical protein BC332_18638 [Capsicum chinense]|nr:putative cyanidin-3-O-glucoside 2-O-glucuronosyltransferase-like [Capsicum annuum]PHU11708.1 hypothetical protein BC332_18638 [Capsicum chinense]
MNESYGNSRASSSSTSSLDRNSQGTEDDHAIATILAEEEQNASKYGGKFGKRLSHLDSIPHTPRVIGEIPDPNDATLDHGRLCSRLATYGLTEMQIEGDGNCQFRALSDQLYHNPEYHKLVRKEVVKQTLDEVAHKKDPLDFIDLSQRRCLIGVSEKENEVIMDHGHEIVPL